MSAGVYMVCGTYRNNNEIIAYRLMRSDGKIEIVYKEKAVQMVYEGRIRNMRIQNSNDGPILRGNGININKLERRSIDELENSRKAKEWSITRRVSQNGKRIGYEITDDKGSSKLINLVEAVKMINNGEIMNAEVHRKTGANGTMFISGKGCNLSSLPEILVANGKILNEVKMNGETCRACTLKESGILIDSKTRQMQRFRAGDILKFSIDGSMQIVKSIEYTDGNTADCDANINACGRYKIKFGTSHELSIDCNAVRQWRIAKG